MRQNTAWAMVEMLEDRRLFSGGMAVEAHGLAIAPAAVVKAAGPSKLHPLVFTGKINWVETTYSAYGSTHVLTTSAPSSLDVTIKFSTFTVSGSGHHLVGAVQPSNYGAPGWTFDCTNVKPAGNGYYIMAIKDPAYPHDGLTLKFKVLPKTALQPQRLAGTFITRGGPIERGGTFKAGKV